MKDVSEIKQRLVEYAKKMDIGEDVLAEHVIDLKSQEACDINNGGVEDQISYLMNHLSEEEIKDAMEEMR